MAIDPWFTQGTPWPNTLDVVDGVVPFEDVPQNPNLFDPEEDADLEMED